MGKKRKADAESDVSIFAAFKSARLYPEPNPYLQKPKRTGLDGLSRHKKRLRLAREEDTKEQAAQLRAARSAKHAARPTKITQLAAPKSSAPQNPNKRKGTFDDEIVKGGKKKREIGGGSAKKGKEEGKGKAKEEKKRDHKLGKVRSVKSFKSKSKFKRRK